MGVNLVGVNRIVHYGAPASIDDYFKRVGELVGQGRQQSQRYIGNHLMLHYVEIHVLPTLET